MAIKQTSVQPGARSRSFAPVPPASKKGAGTSAVSSAVRNVVLGAFLLYCLLPASWIIASMTKDNGQIFSTFGLWFATPLHFFENVAGLFTYQNGIFLHWFGNSLVYAVSITLGSTLICAMGGYAFSKYDFPFKQLLFNFILGTIMVPSTALVLPLFLMLNKVGFVNTMWGVILPTLSIEHRGPSTMLDHRPAMRPNRVARREMVTTAARSAAPRRVPRSAPAIRRTPRTLPQRGKNQLCGG